MACRFVDKRVTLGCVFVRCVIDGKKRAFLTEQSVYVPRRRFPASERAGERRCRESAARKCLSFARGDRGG
eukprot:312824-Rhodomonas_salina.1